MHKCIVCFIKVSRLLEERVGEQEGMSEVKQWLTAIWDGSSMNQIDLGSVKGYKRLRMCEMVRKEISLNMGTGMWSNRLQQICDGRLAPTPWLNRVTFVADIPHISEFRTGFRPHLACIIFCWRKICALSIHGIQDFREPLYLHDKPVWIKDTRSEEQIKYPELFQHISLSPKSTIKKRWYGCLCVLIQTHNPGLFVRWKVVGAHTYRISTENLNSLSNHHPKRYKIDLSTLVANFQITIQLTYIRTKVLEDHPATLFVPAFNSFSLIW